ncbi:MAG: nucleotidyltransferase family protein [Gemmataceae bacterium]
MRAALSLPSPEQEVLIACARRDFVDGHQQQVRAARARGLDWDQLEQAALDHGVAYFVYSHLLSHALVDEPRRTGWQAQLHRESAQALVLRDAQLRLARAFERAQIPVVWLKGLVLSEALYGRSDARQCSDLDVLVEPARMSDVARVLAAESFDPYSAPEPGKDEHPLGDHHQSFLKKAVAGCAILVEVHERLSGPAACQPDVAGMMARARPASLGDVPVQVLCPEDELLVLAMHAHQHNFALLRCLMDVAEYVQRCHNEIDWRVLVERARAGRCLIRLAAALELADRLLGLGEAGCCVAQVPPLAGARARVVRSLSPSFLIDIDREQDERLRLRLAALMDRWSDVLRVYAPRVFPPRAYVRGLCPPLVRRVPLGPHLYYYLWRLAGRLS